VAFEIPVGMLAGVQIPSAQDGPVQCGIVSLHDRACMLIEVGRTGATTRLDSIAIRKILRAQDIAASSSLPLAYLWLCRCELADDAAEVFPDLDAAGNIIFKAAQASVRRIAQFTYSEATDGIGGLVKAAMSEAGFATVAEPSPDADLDTGAALRFVSWLNRQKPLPPFVKPDLRQSGERKQASASDSVSPGAAEFKGAGGFDLTDVMPLNPSEEYDTRDVIEALVDEASFLEYRAEFGRTLLCGYAAINGLPFGIVANQRKHIRQPGQPFEFGGVIYAESADKGARFILDCNQNRMPILFVQDVNGFMVGREAEIAGIIRSGAKMVNAVANSVVPKITLIIGGSYGAGNYALCGKAYDPLFIFAWPTARYAVMGGDQAARTLAQLQIRQAEASGAQLSEEDRTGLFDRVKQTYEEQLDPRYAAARLWIDHIIFPGETRALLSRALQIAYYAPRRTPLKTGVIQT
jgi:acetyl-CoA carboxylase carboxyltransferase component